MSEFIYRNRAVAFLDVLGFREKLKTFESEAKKYISDNIAIDEEKTKGVSERANEFITTFKNAVGRLDKDKYRYYLFSDNICITSTNDTTPLDLLDLLFVISELYYEFAQQGYFLRGGIDYGLFIDEEEIAVGLPLVVAYELESKYAVYPRIVISDNFADQFQIYNTEGEKVFDYLYADMLIKNSCEIKYLNIFLNVFKSDFADRKELFFQAFKIALEKNLEENKFKELIYVKYKWLADEFNGFIDNFVNELAFLDVDFDPEEEVGLLEYIKTQKIKYGN